MDNMFVNSHHVNKVIINMRIKIDKLKRVSGAEQKQIMLSILNDISKFCDDNGLIYYLAYGTLLGAIRHKGFIPWDDDVDIMMPRSDYEKFVTLYREKGNYSINYPLDSGSYVEWVKVYDKRTVKIEQGIDYSICSLIGLDVDIFPIDGQPDKDDYLLFKKDTDYRLKQHNALLRIVCLSANKPIRSKLLALLFRLVGGRFFIKRYIASASKYSYEGASYVGFADPYSWKLYSDRHRKVVFENRIKVEFENGEYWAPVGYDEFLRNIYGDYMKLPPIEERNSHHVNMVYWK